MISDKYKNSRRIDVFSFTETGSALNRRLLHIFEEQGIACAGYTIRKYAKEGLRPLPENMKEKIGGTWGESDLIFIGAAGIAVRYIAPWVKDKFTDPAVIVIDETCSYVIPLLSGHVGGAVSLADWIALQTGGIPVHTTATDVQEKFAVDVFAKKNYLRIMNRETAKKISAAVLDGETIAVYAPGFEIRSEQMPGQLVLCESEEKCGNYRFQIRIQKETGESGETDKTVLRLEPARVVLGAGCRKGLDPEIFEEQVSAVLEQNGIHPSDLAALASINLKKEESAMRRLAEKWKLPFFIYSAEQLNEVEKVSCTSEFVKKTTGTDNVCERAAQRMCMEVCGKEGKLIRGKYAEAGMTAALVRMPQELIF